MARCYKITYFSFMFSFSLNKSKLNDLTEEFADQINYIQDIFELKLENINTILHDELMKRFLIPICISAIGNNTRHITNIQPALAMFLLSQVMLTFI